MFKQLTQTLANYPPAFDGLRNVLENGFKVPFQIVRAFTEGGQLRTLDCGCGTGIFAHLFSSGSYIGVDIHESYLKAARKRCPFHQFIQMDARQLDLPANSFDRAIIFGLLHHLKDDDAIRVCQSVNKMLTPEGELLVCEDIPTRDRWNAIGRLVHTMDLGANIRCREAYANLLQTCFEIQHWWYFTSGFMDYVAFRCLPEKSSIPSPRSNFMNQSIADHAGIITQE